MKKSNIVVFKNGGNLKKCEKWYYKGVLLKVVTINKFYKYLGVVFNSCGTWTTAMNSNCSQANKAFFTLKRLVHKRFGNLPIHLWNQIYIKVLPILLYGSEIWGVDDIPIIEKLNVNFCRFILGIGNTAPIVAVKGECGDFRRYLKRFRYWLRLLNYLTQKTFT